jgi:hypothetical protein
MDSARSASRAVSPETPEAALARIDGAPLALLALGIPRCPATQLLPASLTAVAIARPEVAIALGILQTPEDWAARETLFWPRGIHVSRSVVPILVAMRDDTAIATLRGGASAYLIDRWLAEQVGLTPTRLREEWVADEQDELVLLARRRAQHAAVKGRGAAD